ncbi:MAG TPA: hypothetical protein VJK72_06035 [Candidatus Nanoarchaeia archaeon]|nr:hypothetical protein [Candidatus Nanoarchaeia archaeon]
MKSFLGTYERKFDEKSRLFIPPSLADKLGSSLYIVPCALGILPYLSMYRSKTELQHDTGTQLMIRRLVKDYSMSRITVPLEIRAKSGLTENDCVMIGARNRIEVWGHPHYERMMERAPNIRDLIC